MRVPEAFILQPASDNSSSEPVPPSAHADSGFKTIVLQFEFISGAHIKSRAPPKTPTVRRGQVIQRGHVIQRRPPTRVAVQPRRYARGAGVQKERTQSNIYFISKGNCRCPNKVGLSTLSPARAQRGTSPTPVARYREKVFLPNRGYSTACPITVGRRPPERRQEVAQARGFFFFFFFIFYFLEIRSIKKVWPQNWPRTWIAENTPGVGVNSRSTVIRVDRVVDVRKRSVARLLVALVLGRKRKCAE